MISYRAERNICYRIFKSKRNKASNLFIIHNNHNLSAEGGSLLQGPSCQSRQPLLEPTEFSELLCTARHARDSVPMPGRKYINLSMVKIPQLG